MTRRQVSVLLLAKPLAAKARRLKGSMIGSKSSPSTTEDHTGVSQTFTNNTKAQNLETLTCSILRVATNINCLSYIWHPLKQPGTFAVFLATVEGDLELDLWTGGTELNLSDREGLDLFVFWLTWISKNKRRTYLSSLDRKMKITEIKTRSHDMSWLFKIPDRSVSPSSFQKANRTPPPKKRRTPGKILQLITWKNKKWSKSLKNENVPDINGQNHHYSDKPKAPWPKHSWDKACTSRAAANALWWQIYHFPGDSAQSSSVFFVIPQKKRHKGS